MNGTRVVEEVAALAAADPTVCDRDGLVALVTAVGRVRGWLDALEARVALHADRLMGSGSSEAAAELLSVDGRRSGRDAGTVARRGAVCGDLPLLHDALATGAVSAGHVDAIARIHAGLDDRARAELRDLETALVASARSSPVDRYERELRDLGRLLSRDDGLTRLAQLRQQREVRRWVDRVSGMCHTMLSVDPETDARIAASLDAALAHQRQRADTADVAFEHLKADALVALITGARTTDRRVPELTIVVDLETLRHGLHERSVCETGDGQPLPPETVRRLACTADLLPAVLGGEGVVIDLGRHRRLANRDQHRALRAMYRTCSYPGCGTRFDDCQLHHTVPWEHGGTTDVANLTPLCSRHHHLVHDDGWHLRLHPDRSLTLTRPDGAETVHPPTTDRVLGPPARAPAA